MKLLAIDTSSRTASCAVVEDGVLLGEFYANVKMTHSCTILPMVQNLLECAKLRLSDMDCFGVTCGPGSFTGLRIGLSAVKGMSHALGLPCVAVSTLEALAWNLQFPCEAAPVLDARCSQVYTALFRWKDGVLERLSPDEAVTLQELEARLKNRGTSVFLVGDGAQLCYNTFEGRVPCALPSPALRFTRAAAVALACEQAYLRGNTVLPGALCPAYLRLPQAERELLAKGSQDKKGS